MEQHPSSGPVIELDHAIGYSGKITRSVHLHPNAKDYVMIAGASIIVGDLTDPHNQFFLRGHDDQITCIAISNQGGLIASGQRGDNSDILLWDFAEKRAIFRLSEHDHEVGTLAFSHDDRLLISTGASLDGKLFLWDTSNGFIVASKLITPTLFPEAPVISGFGGFVKDVKLRDTPLYQFATSASQRLTIWSLEPATGAIEGENIATGSYIRHYISFCFSKP